MVFTSAGRECSFSSRIRRKRVMQFKPESRRRKQEVWARNAMKSVLLTAVLRDRAITTVGK